MRLNGFALNETFTPPAQSGNCGTCPGSGAASGTITLNDASDLVHYNVDGANTLVVLDPYVDPDAGPQQIIQGYVPVQGSDYANIVVSFP
jgi:hypothetical protein